MSGIRTNAAAELLGVSPNTLRSWERRFGYPKPRRTQGGHRQYDLTQLEALRRALLETHTLPETVVLTPTEDVSATATAAKVSAAVAEMRIRRAGLGEDCRMSTSVHR